MIDLWLKHVRQEGLVVSQSALDAENLVPIKQTSDDTRVFSENSSDFWQLATNVLEWPENRIQRGENLPAEAICRLTEMGVTLNVDAALTAGKANDPSDTGTESESLSADKAGDPTNDGKESEPLPTNKASEPPRLLIKKIEKGSDPDCRISIGIWSGITEQQAFERHLRDTGVEQGLLVTDHVLRLTYSPQGETPGFLEWPIDGMKTTAGREMLSGLKLLLGRNAIWGSAEFRLDGILKRSRENQNIVSTKLAGQVLGALYTLLRGFTTEIETNTRMRIVAERQPEEFYEGLLSVLMRLVFMLYAEDRELMPSSDKDWARTIYEQGYAVRRLFADLEADAALYPDTMSDRYGAWGRLLGLFQLVHDGAGPDFMHQRRGKLFDPETFPFLVGRFGDDDESDILPVSDKCIYEVLHQLLMLGGERLSYKTLDVEQIGSVYETVMGFTVTRTEGSSIALKSGKGNIPAYINLDAVLAKAPDKRKKYMVDMIDFKMSVAMNKLVKSALTVDDLLAALDRKIDERGSPGQRAVAAGTIILQPTDERRKTGSHYTPRSLTAPIVREALKPVLAQLGEDATPDQVLELKVCDPAMGSGAFLVETCRVLGERLETAWARHPELLPVDARSDPQIFARREVAKRCLYGVDKNHMATNLAKLSLWLVTLARNEDFSFLDHALKTGDSLVGLTFEQLRQFDWRTGGTYPIFTQSHSNKVDATREDRQRIRLAPDNVTFEQQRQRLDEANRNIADVRLGGDAVVAVFFSEAKTKIRRAVMENFKVQFGQKDGQCAAQQLRNDLLSGDHPITPFHWYIEFPEVFTGKTPGFDSIVGNPPFAGKNTIANGSRTGFSDWLKIISPDAHGNADLSAHFFRRAFALLRKGGTMGLIATNTIGQGDTRESGLRYLLQKKKGVIYNARRRVKWPGEAAVVVSTVHISKGPSIGVSVMLDDRSVSRISAFVREGEIDNAPFVLEANKGIAFQGSVLLGMGFTFDNINAAKGKATLESEMDRLKEKNSRNSERIKPYLGGNEVNSDPKHRNHRFVIDFENFPLRRENIGKTWKKALKNERKEMLRKGVVPLDYSKPVASDWPDLLQIVRTLVKPDRDTQNRESNRNRWWIYAENRPGLIATSSKLNSVFGVNRHASFLAIAKLHANTVWAESLIIFCKEELSFLAVLQSRIHEVWVLVFSSTLGDGIRYTPSDCFVNFPFPLSIEGDEISETTGRTYHDFRSNLMINTNMGMTACYNRFHDQLDQKPDITELRRLHAEMDDAVLRAYGWDDLADMALDTSPDGAAPRFLHQTDEPEFVYQKRYHWPAWFRDNVLARLLELNRVRAENELEML